MKFDTFGDPISIPSLNCITDRISKLSSKDKRKFSCFFSNYNILFKQLYVIKDKILLTIILEGLNENFKNRLKNIKHDDQILDQHIYNFLNAKKREILKKPNKL